MLKRVNNKLDVRNELKTIGFETSVLKCDEILYKTHYSSAGRQQDARVRDVRANGRLFSKVYVVPPFTGSMLIVNMIISILLKQ